MKVNKNPFLPSSPKARIYIIKEKAGEVHILSTS